MKKTSSKLLDQKLYKLFPDHTDWRIHETTHTNNCGQDCMLQALENTDLGTKHGFVSFVKIREFLANLNMKRSEIRKKSYRFEHKDLYDIAQNLDIFIVIIDNSEVSFLDPAQTYVRNMIQRNVLTQKTITMVVLHTQQQVCKRHYEVMSYQNRKLITLDKLPRPVIDYFKFDNMSAILDNTLISSGIKLETLSSSSSSSSVAWYLRCFDRLGKETCIQILPLSTKPDKSFCTFLGDIDGFTWYKHDNVFFDKQKVFATIDRSRFEVVKTKVQYTFEPHIKFDIPVYYFLNNDNTPRIFHKRTSFI